MDEQTVLKPIEEMLGRLTVAATFGEPVKEGDVTLIPVASVGYGFGYGYGATQPEDEADTASEGKEAHGGGGGGGGLARPLGFVRVDAEGVRYEPFVNPLAVALAGIAAVAWSVFWITKTVRTFVQKPCCG